MLSAESWLSFMSSFGDDGEDSDDGRYYNNYDDN